MDTMPALASLVLPVLLKPGPRWFSEDTCQWYWKGEKHRSGQATARKKHRCVLHVDQISKTHISLAVCSVFRQTDLCPVFPKVLQCLWSSLNLISILCHYGKPGIHSLLPHYLSQVSGLLTISIQTLWIMSTFLCWFCLPACSLYPHVVYTCHCCSLIWHFLMSQPRDFSANSAAFSSNTFMCWDVSSLRYMPLVLHPFLVAFHLSFNVSEVMNTSVGSLVLSIHQFMSWYASLDSHLCFKISRYLFQSFWLLMSNCL